MAKANKYNSLSIRQLKQTAIEFEAEALKTEMLNGTYQVIDDSNLGIIHWESKKNKVKMDKYHPNRVS